MYIDINLELKVVRQYPESVHRMVTDRHFCIASRVPKHGSIYVYTVICNGFDHRLSIGDNKHPVHHVAFLSFRYNFGQFGK